MHELPFSVATAFSAGTSPCLTQKNSRMGNAEIPSDVPHGFGFNSPIRIPFLLYLKHTYAFMIKLEFSIEIHAPAQHVYECMLGLKDKKAYEHWTFAFNPTSTYEGNWEKGSKMHFIGVDENGKKGGMLSEIVDHQEAKFVSIRHYGMLDGETEITTGAQVEQWAGGHENYMFREHLGITTLTVEIDVVEAYLDYFKGTYPPALERLKAFSEG